MSLISRVANKYKKDQQKTKQERLILPALKDNQSERASSVKSGSNSRAGSNRGSIKGSSRIIVRENSMDIKRGNTPKKSMSISRNPNKTLTSQNELNRSKNSIDSNKVRINRINISDLSDMSQTSNSLKKKTDSFSNANGMVTQTAPAKKTMRPSKALVPRGPNQLVAIDERDKITKHMDFYKKQSRNDIFKKMDRELDLNSIKVPERNTLSGGPGLKDARRNKVVRHQKEAQKYWKDYFGDAIKEVRWDSFEDLLGCCIEDKLSLQPSLIRSGDWDQIFKWVFEKVAAVQVGDEAQNQELPLIPFSKGKTVKMDKYINLVEDDGIQFLFETLAKKFILPEAEIRKRNNKSRLFSKLFSQQLTWEYIDGTVFKGNFVEGKKEGEGILTIPNGDFYKGVFQKGLRHGTGTMTFKDLLNGMELKYEGDWEHDKRHGYGIITMSDESVFSGFFEKGSQIFGKYSTPQGHNYIGHWKGNQMDIEGVLETPDGQIYKGQIEEDKFRGKGELINKGFKIEGHFDQGIVNREGKIETDDYLYEGEIIRGKEHGRGVRTYKAGGKYNGEFKQGTEEGNGERWYANKDYYKGLFQGGLRNGQGLMEYATGDRYEGQFYRNKKQGKGTYYYLARDQYNREEYSGDFKNDLPNGQGKLVFEAGTIYYGEFKDGMINGRGRLILRHEENLDGNHELYEGEFENNKYEGFGKYVINKKVVYEGYWRRGKRHGNGEFYNEFNVKKKGLFCNGELLSVDA